MPSISTSRWPAGIASASALALVDQAARQRFGRIGQPVEVDVEERQPAAILRHEHEARRDDRLLDAKPGAESLRELRLPRAQIPDQADQVARPRRHGQGRRQGARPRRIARDDNAFNNPI